MKRENRLLKNAQFQIVFRKGKLIRTPLCYGYYYDNDLNILRVGIAVSKKVGNAVVRNKVKRQIRAIVRPYVNSHYGDFVFVAKKKLLDASFSDLEKAMAHIFDENGEKNEEKK